MRRCLRRYQARAVPPRLVALVLVLGRLVLLVLWRHSMVGRHGIAAVQEDWGVPEHFSPDLIDHPAHLEVLAPLQRERRATAANNSKQQERAGKNSPPTPRRARVQGSRMRQPSVQRRGRQSV